MGGTTLIRSARRGSREFSAFLGLVAVAALFLAACGGDNGGSGTATPSTSAATTQASATSAPQGGASSAPAAVQAPGTLNDLPSLPVAAAQVDDNATVRIAFAFVELKLDPHKVQRIHGTGKHHRRLAHAGIGTMVDDGTSALGRAAAGGLGVERCRGHGSSSGHSRWNRLVKVMTRRSRGL
jgi:hypothetical protein